uniref:Uncharacterized protein n=1 Tax=Ditylenchus dipsaci TaxID=166011 RepID=A0A915E865_9BILA
MRDGTIRKKKYKPKPKYLKPPKRSSELLSAVCSSNIKLRVLYPQDNFKVIVEQSKGSHDHVPVNQPKLSDQHKELMNKNWIRLL